MNVQTTIDLPISCCGFGMHSGAMVQVVFKPSKANTGIVFVRTDVKSVDNVIFANYQNVIETHFATTISNASNIKIATIEHLMAAIYACGIDNLIIEVDGPEIPIMDGSSKPFIFMIECSGIKYLDAKKAQIKLLKEITIEDNGAYIVAGPCERLEIQTSIEFTSKSIGKQSRRCISISDFKQNISDARTFGFIKELKYLNSKGLGLGVSLQNGIGIDENDQLLTKLRYSDEFVRHKILDTVGDLYTAGSIIGHFECYKSGHYLNNQILRKIFSSASNYQLVA
jgi:UDP-3-O-[3-hydroxymyristoyl] N-acetylglucosamine deacetylase